MKKMLICLFTLLSLIITANAENWVKIGTDNYVDLSRLKYNDNTETYTLWAKVIVDSSNKDFKYSTQNKVGYYILQHGVDCNKMKLRTMRTIIYSTNNSLIADTRDTRGHLEKPAKGTFFEDQMLYVCNTYLTSGVKK